MRGGEWRHNTFLDVLAMSWGGVVLTVGGDFSKSHIMCVSACKLQKIMQDSDI
jgi:hypothetical protein